MFLLVIDPIGKDSTMGRATRWAQNMWQLTTGKRKFVVSKTASYTNEGQESGMEFDNLGATVAVTFSLPTTTFKGMTFTYNVKAAFILKITAGASSAFFIDGAKGSDAASLESNEIANSITIVADGNGDWHVTSQKGGWGAGQGQYDPTTRTFARTEGMGRIYTKAIISDWTAFDSVQSADFDFICSGSGGFGTSKDTDGGVKLSHAATSSSFVFIKPRTGSRFNTINWNTSKTPRFLAIIKTGASIANVKIQVGLQSGGSQPRRFIGPGGSGHSNAAYFFADANANVSWKVDVAGGATSSTSGATGTALATGTVYALELRIDASRIVTGYINKVLVYTSVQALAASKALTPVIGVQTEDNAERGFSLYGVEMSQSIE